ncbi:hypothetical protein EV360DRAFT_87801 [Lentinula raphanica]|nr:hypothetical protein EV360DRAFT_87801 [Lentinula raphanica]
MSDIPSWDGDGKALIDYLVWMNELASRSELLARGLGTWAPDHLTGTTRNWWLTIPPTEKDYLLETWWHLDEFMRASFMDRGWITDRPLEFDSMRFRQSDHKNESPVAFIQRRNHYATFLHPLASAEEEPLFVAHLLSTAPPSWEPHINERNCPTVVQLQSQAKQLSLTLVTVWKTEENFKEWSRVGSTWNSWKHPFPRKAFTTELGEEVLLRDEEDLEVVEPGPSVAAADRRSYDKQSLASQGASIGQINGPVKFERDNSIRSKVLASGKIPLTRGLSKTPEIPPKV